MGGWLIHKSLSSYEQIIREGPHQTRLIAVNLLQLTLQVSGGGGGGSSSASGSACRVESPFDAVDALLDVPLGSSPFSSCGSLLAPMNSANFDASSTASIMQGACSRFTKIQPRNWFG